MQETAGRIGRGGQVTLPSELLKRLGLHDGDSVEFASEGEAILVRAAKQQRRGFEAWIGAFPIPACEGDAVQRQREMRGWDEWDEKEFPR